MMGWSQPFTSSPEHRTRADLTRELDAALHGEQTITFPVTPAKWDALLDEVRALTSSPVSPDRSASSPPSVGLSGGGDAVGQAASPDYDPEGEA